MESIRQLVIRDELTLQVKARAVCRLNPDSVSIELIDVAPPFQGRGLGTQLLGQILASYGHQRITVTTWTSLIPWYRRYGFHVVEVCNNLAWLERLPPSTTLG